MPKVVLLKRIAVTTIFLVTIGLNTNTAASETLWQKVYNSPYIADVATTPEGIFLGEYREIGQSSYNGVYKSKDFAQTWQPVGLANSGITKLYYDREAKHLYAATYYVTAQGAGIYKLPEGGSTWVHLGHNFSASNIIARDKTLLVGTYSNGLWVSFDAGISWTQKIGTGWFGPKIEALTFAGSAILCSSTGKTYISADNGNSWAEIKHLAGKNVKWLTGFTNNTLFAIQKITNGVNVSLDNGTTWVNTNVPGTPGGNVFYIEGTYYIGVTLNNNVQTIAKSVHPQGPWTIESTSLQGGHGVISLDYYVSDNQKLLMNFQGLGLYTTSVETAVNVDRFLDIPWNTHRSNILDKLTAYFDHQYPLLGYAYFKEPRSTSDTTMDFIGQASYEPTIYYSSHNGSDFALPIGTPVLAPADGIAHYQHCTDCGNTIWIDHQNGYASKYMHLLNTELITLNTPIQVTRGQMVGRVGMTGRTTGPHLHFSVLKDQSGDSSFSDDYPAGLVDAFGWWDTSKYDPWEVFNWEDALGAHVGSESSYLWNSDYVVFKYIPTPPLEEQRLEYENKVITYINSDANNPQILKAAPYTMPINSTLHYMPGTSIVLNMVDLLGQTTAQALGSLKVKATIDLSDMSNIIEHTVAWYVKTKQGEWEKLNSIYDSASRTVSTIVPHLSWFAVFAETQDKEAPSSNAEPNGNVLNGWYINPPTITLTTNDPDTSSIYYSLDNGNSWSPYTMSFAIPQVGVATTIYKAVDENENWEQANTITVKTVKSGENISKVLVSRGTFRIN